MSDVPPAWRDQGPPPDAYDAPTSAQRHGDQPPARRDSRRDDGRGGNYERNDKPNRVNFPAPARSQAAGEFFAWLADRKTLGELQRVLPNTVRPEKFAETAKQAVMTNTDLLWPAYRESLLQAVLKAAHQGLPPDGKHGAMVPRWDDRTREVRVVWQPMVWGLMRLGRETGAIRQMRAHIVFDGEVFEIEQGDEDRIIHRVNPEIVEAAYQALTPDAFMQYVQAAYCVITATDGTVTKRWMPRSRIARVRASAKASNGPWAGAFIDEMILKTVILYTSKWINLDADSPAAQRFMEALRTDMEADFDADGRALPAGHQQAALPAPGLKLDTLEQKLFGFGQGEPVPVGNEAETPPPEQENVAPPPAEPPAPPPRPPQKPASPAPGDEDRAIAWARSIRGDLQAMRQAGQVAELRQNAAFKSRLEALRRLDPSTAEDLEDAAADREAFLAQVQPPSKAGR